MISLEAWAGIGIASIISVICFMFVFSVYKISDFLNDVHVIAENTKKG